ncbi:MAG: hypothetical protein K8J31_24505 [Anaerolineae bacterium]|nr:hypothetical protein [Anaerolineae bacterium]
MAGDKGVKVSIDQLSKGKLPERVYESIDSMELTVSEMLDWESSKQPTRILVTKQALDVDIHLRIPMKHLLLILVGAGGFGAIVGWIAGLTIS